MDFIWQNTKEEALEYGWHNRNSASNIAHMNTKANEAWKIENNAFVIHIGYTFPLFL